MNLPQMTAIAAQIAWPNVAPPITPKGLFAAARVMVASWVPIAPLSYKGQGKSLRHDGLGTGMDQPIALTTFDRFQSFSLLAFQTTAVFHAHGIVKQLKPKPQEQRDGSPLDVVLGGGGGVIETPPAPAGPIAPSWQTGLSLRQ